MADQTREDEKHPLQQAIERLRENDDARYRPTRYVLPRRVYDELDLWFVEVCTHEGRDRCSVCRTETRRGTNE